MRSLLALFCLTCPHTASAAEWTIDKAMKFNFAYLPSASARATTEAKPLLAKRDAFRPDIDNIDLTVLLNLDFPLPFVDLPTEKRFNIKLYTFPSALNPALSSHRALDPFRLSLIKGGPAIMSFAEKAENLAVKFSVIANKTATYSANTPFPSLTLAEGMPPQRQSEFDSSVPFTSLYLRPARSIATRNNDEKAKHSADGVVAFHKDLLAAYRATMIEIDPGEKNVRFVEPHTCATQRDMVCGVTILEIAREPMVFANYRDLPMPQGPNVFLTGLLLVKVTDYALSLPLARIESARTDFNTVLCKGTPQNSQVLEVGSIITF